MLKKNKKNNEISLTYSLSLNLNSNQSYEFLTYMASIVDEYPRRQGLLNIFIGRLCCLLSIIMTIDIHENL